MVWIGGLGFEPLVVEGKWEPVPIHPTTPIGTPPNHESKSPIGGKTPPDSPSHTNWREADWEAAWPPLDLPIAWDIASRQAREAGLQLDLAAAGAEVMALEQVARPGALGAEGAWGALFGWHWFGWCLVWLKIDGFHWFGGVVFHLPEPSIFQKATYGRRERPPLPALASWGLGRVSICIELFSSADAWLRNPNSHHDMNIGLLGIAGGVVEAFQGLSGGAKWFSSIHSMKHPPCDFL